MVWQPSLKLQAVAAHLQPWETEGKLPALNGMVVQKCNTASKGGNVIHEECYKKYLKTFIEVLSLALG